MCIFEPPPCTHMAVGPPHLLQMIPKSVNGTPGMWLKVGTLTKVKIPIGFELTLGYEIRQCICIIYIYVSVLPLGIIPNMYHLLDSSASFLRCWIQDSERPGSGCSSAIFETLMGKKSILYIYIYIVIITFERQTHGAQRLHSWLGTFYLNPNEASFYINSQWEIKKHL